MDIKRMIYDRFKFRSRTDNLPWSSPKGNRNDLAALFADADFNYGAEIGVQYGKFSKVLLDANPNLNLLCIDPWIPYNSASKAHQDEAYDIASIALFPYCDRAKMIRKTSMDALNDVEDRSLDFVWIDGNHMFDYACTDVIWWPTKVKKGGIIGVHDYYPMCRGGVVQAVDAYTRAHSYEIPEWYCTREKDVTAFWINP